MSSSEEFLSGENTFEDSDGNVYATLAGRLVKDEKLRRASILAFKKKQLISRGDLVYGRVEDVYDTIALVSIQPAKKLIASPNNFAYLRISEVQKGFVESFNDNIAIGDVIRARVREVTPLGIYLTIAERDLGVVRAFCGKCRRALSPRNHFLECGECGSREKRKMPAPSQGSRGKGELSWSRRR